MLISSDKSNSILLLFALILNLFVVIFFYLLGGLIPSIILFICGTTLLVSNYIAINRTVIMNEFGYKVTLGKYTREYTWADLSIKRIEPPHIGLRLSYHSGGAFFSIFPVRKPKWIDPALYCTLFHPFSCFFVYFKNKDSNQTPGIYEVDKNSFLDQLEFWGIYLDSN